MSDKFPSMVVEPFRTNLSWHGKFHEPAFSVFTNPAGVYAAMHRYLKPYGGDLADLGVESTVLSNAHITYSLLGSGGPVVRLRLERIEVAFLDWRGGKTDGRFVDGLRQELAHADPGLTATQADVSLDTWLSLEEGNYSEWFKALVVLPEAHANLAPRVVLHGSNWSIAFEPAARFVRRGLYVRYTGTYGADVSSADNMEEASNTMWTTLQEFGIRRA